MLCVVYVTSLLERGRGRWLTPLVCAALLGSPPAFAQSPPTPTEGRQPQTGPSADELARRHFESGVAYLQESDYDNALKAFQKAYDLSHRPEILLNVATVHERRNDLKSAVAALEQYLTDAPQGEHVETVKLRIANLKKRLEEAPPEAAPAPAPPAAAPQPVGPAPQAAVAAAPPAEAEDHKPSRIPAFILLGVGGLAAGGAVLTGLFAQSEYDDAKGSCSPNCSDDQLSTGRTLAITSTVLTGVAVVGAGLGVTLLLTAHSNRERATASPALHVAASSKGGGATATWRF
jgi:hypothetical protein